MALNSADAAMAERLSSIRQLMRHCFSIGRRRWHDDGSLEFAGEQVITVFFGIPGWVEKIMKVIR